MKLRAFPRVIALLLAVIFFSFSSPADAQGVAKIYFVDIGTGAGTLIVSPTGKSLLVDGGPPGAGTTKIVPLLASLGISTIDYTVLTHYHIDHDGGLTEVFNAGRVTGGIAYDNGDAPGVIPPSLTGSTGVAYTAYKNAVTAGGATRQTIAPGQLIDLGGGMTATCLAVGGHLLSGGSVTITNEDLNSESISLLIQYNGFSYLVSGDLTGGGSTSTEKSPDVETWVGQLAGDVDAVQLNHHGSTSASNQKFLSALRAEVAFAETGSTNTFGHPNRETVNKFLNTPTTTGATYGSISPLVPPPGSGPVFYQIEQSSSSDDRETQQGYYGAPTSSPGTGTLLLETDGIASYSISSFDDGGVRIPAALHTYALDSASSVTTDFPPTVIPITSPAAPLAGESVTVTAQVMDRESPITSVTLAYSLNGAAQPLLPMTPSGGLFVATIPAQPDGTRVDFSVTGVAGAQTTTYSSGYFSGVTSIATLRVLNALGEPLYAGYPARVQGLVTAGSGLFGSVSNDDYVDDGTGAINVYRSTNGISVYTPTTTGQTAEVVGHIESVGGRLRLDLTDSVEKTVSPWHTTILPNAIATPSPVTTTIAALLATPEAFEGKLVSISNASIISGTIPATSASLDAFVVVGDGTGSIAMKIDHDTDIEGFVVPSVFTLVGIVQQDDFLRPFDGSYDIAPRSRVDLGASAPAPPPLLAIATAREDLVNNADLNPVPDFVPDRIGHIVKVRGTVTSINFRPTGTEYYIQDATGGIDIFATSTSFGSFGIGTTVEATGTVTQFNGLTELQVTSVTPTGSATPPAPLVVTLSQLADGGVGEAVEGLLIRVDNVTITSGSYPLAGASGNVTIADATGSVAMRIDSDTNIDGTATTAGTFTVVALASQFVSAAPFDSGYQILPRSLADIVVTGAPALAASPTSLDFASVNVGGSAIRTVTITNTGLSTLTLSPPFSIVGSGASQYTAGAPATTTLASGAATTVSVTFAPTTSGTKTASLNVTSTTGDSVPVALTGLATTPGGGGGATGVVISELRFRGPGGASDEFVEIYNSTDAAVDISGWKMNGSNNAGTTSTRATVPASTSLPPRAHYLFVNSAAGALVAMANQTYGTGITDDGGVALLNASSAIVDQVGLSATSAYKEGTTLPNLGTTTASNLDRGYERLPGGANGSTQDTNNNAADFALKAPSDPQNLSSTPTGAITASPSSLDFGSLPAGATANATVTITNHAASTIALTTPFALTGTNASDFGIGSSTTSLAGGASTTATISFHPAAVGGKAATATITSPGGAPTVALTGVATPGISVAPPAIDFGSLDAGASASSSLTITNDDPSNPVTLTTPFPIAGATPGAFSVGVPGTTTLGGGESTSVVVGFLPTAPGGKSAILSIASAAGSVRTVALSGSSACPAISIDGSLTSGILLAPYSRSLVASGGLAPYTFSIIAGVPPTGLTFSPAGVLSGIPSVAAAFDFTVQATDALGCFATSAYSVSILAATITGTPSPLDLGTVFLGSHGSLSLTITNLSGFPVTLSTPLAISGTDAAQFSVGAPGTTTLGAGASTTASLTFTPTTTGTKSATLTIVSSAGGLAGVPLTATARFGPSVGSTLLISELRFRGAGGAGGAGAASDEFVEIYNSTPSPIDISGYRLLASNNAGVNSTRATVPASTTLPPHAHYLFVNTAAQAGLLALANQTYPTGITDDGGVAISLQDGTTLLDQAGLSAGSAFREGTSLPALTASLNQSYERKPGGAAGSTLDTGDNASDFQLISPSGPQNLTSVVTPPLITVAPDPQDFGSVALGSAGTGVLTITNTATVPIALTTPFAISGADAGQFSVDAPSTGSIPGGGTATVGVTFTPTTLGAKSASLTIGSGNGGARTVALLGTASCPSISVSGALAGGVFGIAYAGDVTASGGAAPYALSVSTGSLPTGLALSAAGHIDGTAQAAGSFAFTVQAQDASGCSGSGGFTIVVAKAATHITWANPAPIVYGTALSVTQLNATADATGTFAYTPAAGAVLNAGLARPLHVDFTPADSANYENSSASATIDVSPAPLTATAASFVREFGDPNPALTGSVVGVVNGDPITGTFSTAATSSSPIGSYPIVTSLADPSGRLANYSVTLVNGTLSVVDTHPPVITLLGANPMTSEAGTPFSDPGATALDAAAGPEPVVATSNVNANVPGNYTITYTSTDGSGNSSSAIRAVKVVDTTPPTITLNGSNPLTIQCHGSFVDPGATATDSVGGNLTGSIVAVSNVNPNLPGSYTVKYTVSDASGNQATATRVVNVVDTTPPALSKPKASPNLIWPPNGRMVLVTVGYDAADNCSSATCSLSVTSDEPVSGPGNGHTSPDWEIVDAHHVRLRAERSDHGDGRTYTITVTCRDASGNAVSRSATVVVPRNRCEEHGHDRDNDHDHDRDDDDDRGRDGRDRR